MVKLFYREKANGNLNGEGIGLSFVLRAANRLGGKVWVDSKPGRGSSFFLAMPAARFVNMPKTEALRTCKFISTRKDAIQGTDDRLGLSPL